MNADRNEDKTPEEIEADIADTREDLGDTVAAVADKADVKKQAKKKAKKKVADVKEQAAEIKDQLPVEFEGSAGDIGSGPTGDIRPNDAVGAGKGLAENPLVLVAAAFVVGLAIGRWTTK